MTGKRPRTLCPYCQRSVSVTRDPIVRGWRMSDHLNLMRGTPCYGSYRLARYEVGMP